MSVAVAGPAANVTVRSLVVGGAGASVDHGLNMQSGVTLTATDSFTLHESATVNFAIAGPAAFSRLVTSGAAALDGELQASLQGGFMPAAGQSFDLIDWNSVRGSFSSVSLPSLAADLVWGTSQLGTAGLLKVTFAADFDEDFDVDATDLAMWRGGFGTNGVATHLQGDADGDLDVDGRDFLIWQRQLGSVPAVAAADRVPEPNGLALASLAGCGLALLQIRRR